MSQSKFPMLKFAWLWLWAVALQMAWWFPWHLRVLRVGLDNSFRYAQNDLFARGAQFGSDVVVQYGPWGFLKNDLYHPDTVHLLLGVRVLLIVVFASLVARAADRLEFGWWRASVWIALLAAVSRFGEPYFLTLGLLVYVVFRESTGHEERIVWSPVAFVLALVSLMQFTYAVINVAVVAAMVLTVMVEWLVASPDGRVRNRAASLVEAAAWPALFCFGVVFLWAAAGQGIETLPVFFSTRLDLTGSYSTSHVLPGPMWQVAIFSFAAAVFWCVFSIREWRRVGWLAVPSSCLVATCLFVAYKHSFVRQDPGHLAYGAFEGLCIVLVFGTMMAAQPSDSKQRYGRFAAIVAMLLMGVASFTLITYDREHWYGARFFRHLDPRTTARSVVRVIEDPDFVGFRHRRAMARIRKAEPLPPLEGTVDVYPWELSLAYAHGFALRPRPTLQSYQATEPELAERNARHLVWPDGPDHLLFRVATLDGRFPAMDDGPSWPLLLANYRLRRAGGPHLVLDRRRQPREVVWQKVASDSIEFGRPLAIDHPVDRLLWIRIRMDRTVLGRLATTVYRAPVVSLRVRLNDGGEPRYRVVPGMARAGFLLSPVVDDTPGFVDLLDGSWPRRLRGKRVNNISLATEFGESWYWKREVVVELTEFTVR